MFYLRFMLNSFINCIFNNNNCIIFTLKLYLGYYHTTKCILNNSKLPLTQEGLLQIKKNSLKIIYRLLIIAGSVVAIGVGVIIIYKLIK